MKRTNNIKAVIDYDNCFLNFTEDFQITLKIYEEIVYHYINVFL